MAVALFFADFLLLLTLFLCTEEVGEGAFPAMGAYVKSAVFFSLFIGVLTEVLSLANVITWAALTSVYAVLFVVLVAIVVALLRRTNNCAANLRSFGSVILRHKVVTALVVLLAIAPLLFIGIYYPPNNMDSMAYHLPRVEHWIQDRNLFPYPTDYLAQIFNQPLAEEILLQLLLLSGNDVTLFVVQFAAATGAVGAVMMIVREMGFPTKTALLSGLFAGAIPIGVLESTSTQNDFVAAFFACAFVLYGLRTVRRNPAATLDLILTATSAALGALTKLTVAVFMAPFAIWFISELIVSRRFALMARAVGWVLVIFIVTNAMYYDRNLQSTGHLLGPTGSTAPTKSLGVGTSPFKALVSNSVKNIAMQFSTPSLSVNGGIARAADAVSKLLGVNPNGKGLNAEDGPFSIPNFDFSEDTSGNPTTVVLFVLALILLLSRKVENRRDLSLFSLCVVFGLLAFSAGMRWQTYGSRYLLPLFALAMTVVGPVMGAYHRRVGTIAVILASLWALPYVYMDYNRPLLPVWSLAHLYREHVQYLPPHLRTDNVDRLDPTDKRDVLRVYSGGNNGFELDPFVSSSDRKAAFAALARYHITGVPRGNPLTRPRYLNYFSYKPEFGEDYLKALSEASRHAPPPRAVELKIPGMSWEYPVWVWFRENERTMPFISYAGRTRGYTPAPGNTRSDNAFDWMIVQDGAVHADGWHLIGDSSLVKVYAREGTP